MADGDKAPIDIADLAARLKRLEDERDIRATIAQYGHTIDYGLEDQWVDMFTPDAVYSIRLSKPPANLKEMFPFAEVDTGGFTLRGAKALAAFAAMHTRPPQAYHKHVATDFVIAFDGPDSARVTTYVFRIDGYDDSREIMALGRHIDRVVRCADGRWRVAERRYEMESNGMPKR